MEPVIVRSTLAKLRPAIVVVDEPEGDPFQLFVKLTMGAS